MKTYSSGGPEKAVIKEVTLPKGLYDLRLAAPTYKFPTKIHMILRYRQRGGDWVNLTQANLVPLLK